MTLLLAIYFWGSGACVFDAYHSCRRLLLAGRTSLHEVLRETRGRMTREELEQKYSAQLVNCFDFSPPNGWLGLVDEALSKAVAMDPDVQVAQIKEKFATLCFNLHNGSLELHRMLGKFGEDSRHVCQDCGSNDVQVVQFTHGHWVRTECPDCHAKFAKSRGK